MNIKIILVSFIKKILPIYIRKKIRFKFQYIFGKKYSTDEYNLINKIKNVKTVIFFGVTEWDYRVQRTQHLATGLAKKGWQVIFIEPNFILSKSGDKPPFFIKQNENNVYILKLSSFKNFFIYNDLPNNYQLNFIFKSLERFLDINNINDYRFIVAHPFWTDLVSLFNCTTIYDCMDFHSGFKENSNNIIKKEFELFKLADKIVVTSVYLKRLAIKNSLTKNIYLIENAGDFEHFYFSKNNFDKKLKNIKIGYVGAVNDWFDTSILENLAKTKILIEIVGKLENKKVIKLAKKYKNILLYGEISYKKLPKIINGWDVCLIPFLINELTISTNPVKIYEYFSQGKPVISSKLPELEKYADLIYFLNGKENKNDLLKLINNILDERNIIKNNRIRIAENNTWDNRVSKFEEIL